MSEVDSTTKDSTEPPEKAQLGLGLVGVALILPVYAGVVLCFVTSYPVAFRISAATVIATAALVAIDATSLEKVDSRGRPRDNAFVLFIGMCLFWIVVYPFAYFRRSAFGSPNLGVASIFVAIFFIGFPFIGASLIPARLPTCTSTEVVQLLEQAIRGTPFGDTVKSIDGHREISHDSVANVRHGECVVHTDSGDIPLKFIVEWQDRENTLFQVRILEPELPLCTSRVVAQLLELVVRMAPLGAKVNSIDGHREISYDDGENMRLGECVAHTDSGDLPVKFIVEWQDREKGLVQVRRLPAPELPLCTSVEVAQLLEQVIRRTPLGAKANSIDGHREISNDGGGNMRLGECVAHTDSGDFQVKFIVDWQDRQNFIFQVRLLISPD